MADICRQCECRPVRIKYRQLCKTCSAYENKTGHPRPKSLDDPGPKPGELCSNCHRDKIFVKKCRLCDACYNYWVKYGRAKHRPKELYARDEVEKFCIICSESAKKLKRDRCQSCYSYHCKYKFKKDRPYWMWTPAENRSCRNPYCPVDSMLYEKAQRGYCNACYAYVKRTRTLRFKERFELQPCINCQSTCNRKTVDGRCVACAWWFRDHGEERPPSAYQHLRDNPRFCINPKCGNPVPDHDRRKGGYCGPCQTYRHRNHGAMRPHELCEMDFPKPRCSCGEVATREITVEMTRQARQRNKGQKYTETYQVCDECYEIEQQIQEGLL